MMFLVDTSVWLALDKDQSQATASLLETCTAGVTIVMLEPIRLELLQGCRGPAGWNAMLSRLDAFELKPITRTAWDSAARIYYDARQSGTTIRSSIDCLIAQSCLDHDLTLIHNDRDFDTIAKIRPLEHIRLDLAKT
jgi:predicted nucleic acid-binding protein